MTREEIVFAEGFNAKKINDDFWSLSFNVEKFSNFMEAYKTESGYLNINICQSRSDAKRYYGKLNTWTPTKEDKKEEPKTAQEVFEGEVIGDEEIPF